MASIYTQAYKPDPGNGEIGLVILGTYIPMFILVVGLAAPQVFVYTLTCWYLLLLGLPLL